MVEKHILSGGFYYRSAISGLLTNLWGLEVGILAERWEQRENRTVPRLWPAAIRF